MRRRDPNAVSVGPLLTNTVAKKRFVFPIDNGLAAHRANNRRLNRGSRGRHSLSRCSRGRCSLTRSCFALWRHRKFLPTVLTAVATESSPQNVLTFDLAKWVRKLYKVGTKSHGATQCARYLCASTNTNI